MERPPRHPLRVPSWPRPAPSPPDFAAIRAELGVPEDFPADALAEAEAAAARPPLPELDATDVELVTLDPPGSRDLDQAVHLAERNGGFRVTYAIADVGGFVRLGGALDAEARRRGQTVYSPDRRVPLHPTVLSEGAASLLPGQVTPAVVWTLDLDGDGELTTSDVRRARVRSRAQLDYPGVQAQATPARCPAPWPCCRGSAGCCWNGPPTAAPSSWAPPSRRCSPRRTAAGPLSSAATCPSRRGTRRSRCSPAGARPG